MFILPFTVFELFYHFAFCRSLIGIQASLGHRNAKMNCDQWNAIDCCPVSTDLFFIYLQVHFSIHDGISVSEISNSPLNLL